ncbi:CHAP domain-containing protein [Amycolatopsis sp. NPDC101161]|uniref:CHAP domain-containing protein n=1 Tax=Amycolatopsis sp. NPDC101161 TaxID=3363940 RepID=UPI00381AA944
MTATTLSIGASAEAGADDYPATWRNASMDSMIDSWGMYNRECTSFVAWRLHSRNGFEMPFHDNASGWGPDAQARGYVVNPTPAAGSVAWWADGHDAWVESVNSGGTITVEEYNHSLTGTYGERTIAANAVSGYIHFKDIISAPPAVPTHESMQPAAQTLTGGFVVFGRGNDQQLYNAWQSAPGSSWTPFQPVTSGGGLSAPPAIYREADGRFSAYAVNTSGTLLTTWQTSPGSAWQPWTVIGGSGVTGIPIVERASTGGLVVFVRGVDGQLYNTWQPSAGSSWVALQVVTPGGSLTGTPAIHREPDGRFSAYAINSNGILISTWQSAPGSAWQPWAVIAGGTPLAGKAVVDVASTGGLVLFARGTDGQLYNAWQPLTRLDVGSTADRRRWRQSRGLTRHPPGVRRPVLRLRGQLQRGAAHKLADRAW